VKETAIMVVIKKIDGGEENVKNELEEESGRRWT
jgi:hypothetical protein